MIGRMVADFLNRVARGVAVAGLVFVGAVAGARGQELKAPLDLETNQPPKAARSVHFVYDAVEGDMYYSEMRIDKTTDNSFFVPCAWQNGYFGFQQFDGENK